MKNIGRCKRYLSLLLALVVTVCSVLPYNKFVKAESSANSRVATYIGLAAGKATQGLEEGLSLTQDELRFIGVYLSNFYVPFGTELGVTEEEKSEQTKETMTKALQTNLKFNDDLASTFVETIIGLSRSNYKELEFRVSKDYQKDYKKVKNLDVNVDFFYSCMLGANRITQWYEATGDIMDKIDYDPNYGKYNYGYFGYTDGSDFIPMFDCTLMHEVTSDNKYLSKVTPSMVAFQQCLASVDTVSGYGFSFFDFTQEEVEEGGSLKKMLENSKDEDIYNMSILGSRVCVDCFGNIIFKGANHQYIAVPGCMNPYTWVSTNGKGEDVYNAGHCYNMITFMGLGLADSSNLCESKVTFDSNKPALKHLKMKFGKYTKALEDVSDEWDKVPYAKIRMIRGNNETGTTSSIPFISGKYEKLICSAFKGQSAVSSLKDYYTVYRKNLEKDLGKATKSTGGAFCYTDVALPTNPKNGIPVIDNFIFIDNLGAFGFDDTDSEINLVKDNGKYEAINMEHYLNKSGESPNQLFKDWGSDPNNGFTNQYKDVQSGYINTTITASQEAVVGVYTTYAFAGLYQDDAKSRKATLGFLGFRLNKEGMVDISNSAIAVPDSVQDSIVDNTIRDWIFYLLHPKKTAYVRELIKNKVNAILVGWHNDMVGTNGVGATTGATLYKSNYGYVTTPDLSEIQWSSALISFYQNLVPFLIVLMIILMVLAYITGIMSLQKSFFGVLVFAVFLLTPVTLINNVVGISNRISQNIYGEKFTYWALVQQESYAEAIDKASSGESYSNYLRTLYAKNSEVYSNQGSDSVVLKWQAPKKMASLMFSKDDKEKINGLQGSNLLSKVLNSNAYSGQSYLNKESTYMYRSYIDIGNFSRYVYNGIKEGKIASHSFKSNESMHNYVTTAVDESLASSIEAIGNNYKNDRTNGYTNMDGNNTKDYNSQIRITAPLTCKMYLDAIDPNSVNIQEMGIDDFVGINQEMFNFSTAMFNVHSSNRDSAYKILKENSSDGNKADLADYMDEYNTSGIEKEVASLASYGLMSENPFYYFSWSLYDQGMDTGALTKDGFRNLLLKQEDGGFFYNTEGNGELKDFMDMKSLFTYVIPYLRQGNDVVKQWDEVYGIFIYDGVPTEEGHWKDADIKDNAELKQKYWHNLNVARLYMIYTPWVDLMYDCSYAQPETISVLGEKVTISDPINPASYPANRPMIFSESEMTDYGLVEADLTKVEQLILQCNRDMQERIYDLLNYYNFSDLTLNTASAINCTFAFNVLFSESGFLKENINLYPQSFELVDFSYDAFLRFILANTLEGVSDSDNINSQDDFYQTVVNNSSTTTAIMYIVLDVVSQYALPACKIFFIVTLFVSCVLLVLVTAFRVDTEQKFIVKLLKGLVKPMLFFMLVNIGFAWIVSLFMGSGNKAVTQTNDISITMGDPVVVMIALLALDILVIILYYKSIRGVFADIAQNFKLTTSFVGGMISGIGSSIGNAVSSVGSKVSGKPTSGGSSRGGSPSGGAPATRAMERASSVSIQDKEEQSETRRNDTKRNALNLSKSSGMDKKSEDKKAKLDAKVASGANKMSNTSDSDENDTRTDSRDKADRSGISVKDLGDNKK